MVGSCGVQQAGRPHRWVPGKLLAFPLAPTLAATAREAQAPRGRARNEIPIFCAHLGDHRMSYDYGSLDFTSAEKGLAPAPQMHARSMSTLTQDICQCPFLLGAEPPEERPHNDCWCW